VWRTDLELDDGDATISLHLATPKSLGAGKVHTMLKLPFNILPAGGRQSASWSIYPTAQDDQLGISLQLGTLQLEGRGERRGLRCSAFAGTVFEGGDDPCAVGNFAMQLALPIQSDLGPLEQRYHERIASRPAPPIAYTRAGFVGRWRLLISVDEHAPNARFPIELSDDGTWQSVGTEQTLAGTWGMRGGFSSAAGSSVWLKVHRFHSSETLRGVAGLPVRSDFHIEGVPVLETAEQELAARACASGGAGGGSAGGDGAAGAVVDRVNGRLRVGDDDIEYFGRFDLLRGWSEGEAKHAWLARLDAPSWGQMESEEEAETHAEAAEAARLLRAEEQQRGDRQRAAELERQLVELQATQELQAAEEAELARQQRRLAEARLTQAAQAAQLQQQLAETRTREAAANAAAERAAAAEEVCEAWSSSCEEVASEELRAKRAWLARIDAPR